MTKIQLNLSQNALKLAPMYNKKTDIPDLRFKGEKGVEGAGEWQREEEGGR